MANDPASRRNLPETRAHTPAPRDSYFFFLYPSHLFLLFQRFFAPRKGARTLCPPRRKIIQNKSRVSIGRKKEGKVRVRSHAASVRAREHRRRSCECCAAARATQECSPENPFGRPTPQTSAPPSAIGRPRCFYVSFIRLNMRLFLAIRATPTLRPFRGPRLSRRGG